MEPGVQFAVCHPQLWPGLFVIVKQRGGGLSWRMDR